MIYDKDGSETLDVAETGQLLRALGMTPTFVQGIAIVLCGVSRGRARGTITDVQLRGVRALVVREIIREFDKDKSGTLSFEEFLNLYAKYKAPPASSKDLLEAFKVFDTAGNGKIRCGWASRGSSCAF